MDVCPGLVDQTTQINALVLYWRWQDAYDGRSLYKIIFYELLKTAEQHDLGIIIPNSLTICCVYVVVEQLNSFNTLESNKKVFPIVFTGVFCTYTKILICYIKYMYAIFNII